jgi:hypothetical protein
MLAVLVILPRHRSLPKSRLWAIIARRTAISAVPHGVCFVPLHFGRTAGVGVRKR